MGSLRGRVAAVALSVTLGAPLHSSPSLAQENNPPATPPEAQEPPAAELVPEDTTASTSTPPAPDESETRSGSTRLEKVVVTANKREQVLTDVPMSISAISGKDLEKNGAKSFTDYAQTVPSLNFGNYGEGRQRISLRGLQAPTGVSTVAYLVDGIEQGDSPPDPELFDIDHIEILRGPQGTLYGAGAVGGAIKIQTNRANQYAFQSRFLGSLSKNAPGAAGYDLNGMVNVPLIKGELGARVVGFRRHADGYITIREPNFNNPPPFKSFSDENVLKTDANFTTVSGGRLAVDWKAASDLTVGAKYSTETRHTGYGPGQSIDADEKYGGYNFKRGSTPLSGDSVMQEYRQATFNVDWKTPWFGVQSVTGMADVKEDLGMGFFIVLPVIETAEGVVGVPLPIDIPALPAELRAILDDLGLPSGAAVGDMFEIALINQHSYISQELRLVSAPSSSPLTWTTGLFYKVENRQAYEDVFAGPVLGPVLAPDGPYDQVNLRFFTEEYAVYGQLEYAITQKLTALAGLRYYRANLEDTATGGGTDGSVFTPRFSDVSPKFTLSYHFTDTFLAYATAAKGFRIGGVNFSTVKPPPPNLQRTYDPDVLWNYEIGINSTLFDGRVSLSAAIFNSIWKNLQNELFVHSDPAIEPGSVTPDNPTGVFQAGGNERIVINAGRAHSRGVEAESTVLLPLDLTWTFAGAYIQAALDQDLPNPATEGTIPKGTSLENVPHFAGSTSLSHDLRFNGGWGLASSVSYIYRGETHADITNPDESVSEPYSLINVRLGLHGRSAKWSADVFANNLLNERASSFTFNHSGTPNTLPDHTDSPLAYRTIGLRASYSF